MTNPDFEKEIAALRQAINENELNHEIRLAELRAQLDKRDILIARLVNELAAEGNK